ncbi:putative cyanobacterial protein, TIGR03792 family [Leptolyngbyaceae cyanobacterium JSC-12]|nr:putative cyanobacterial protein, TIGR03792 family [Leptolyngbyaceae cyanobacterium JSC-12]
MVIEWLKFQVAETLRETFVQKDEEIWTAALAKYPGFMGKEVWLTTDKPDEVIFVIQWESLDAWKSIPADVLENTEQAFAQQVGEGTYKIVESNAYQLRKFARSIS